MQYITLITHDKSLELALQKSNMFKLKFAIFWQAADLLSTVAALPQQSYLPSPLKVDFAARELANTALPLDAQLIGLSIEFGNIVDFFGDVGSPNEYSRQLLENVIDKGGKSPILRLGGNTQDRSYFCEDCERTMNNVYNGTGPKATEATLVTYNKKLFRLLQDNLDETQDFIFGLNFGTSMIMSSVYGCFKHGSTNKSSREQDRVSSRACRVCKVHGSSSYLRL